eukprot:m.146370 g.146370  ORF g.146370 m.146370 type:complete len:428 (-) comp10091_c0_seq1:957-2240(-)
MPVTRGLQQPDVVPQCWPHSTAGGPSRGGCSQTEVRMRDCSKKRYRDRHLGAETRQRGRKPRTSGCPAPGVLGPRCRSPRHRRCHRQRRRGHCHCCGRYRCCGDNWTLRRASIASPPCLCCPGHLAVAECLLPARLCRRHHRRRSMHCLRRQNQPPQGLQGALDAWTSGVGVSQWTRESGLMHLPVAALGLSAARQSAPSATFDGPEAQAATPGQRLCATPTPWARPAQATMSRSACQKHLRASRAASCRLRRLRWWQLQHQQQQQRQRCRGAQCRVCRSSKSRGSARRLRAARAATARLFPAHSKQRPHCDCRRSAALPLSRGTRRRRRLHSRPRPSRNCRCDGRYSQVPLCLQRWLLRHAHWRLPRQSCVGWARSPGSRHPQRKLWHPRRRHRRRRLLSAKRCRQWHWSSCAISPARRRCHLARS